MSKLVLKISGTRGEMYYAPQQTTLLSMMRVIRQHVGKVSSFERYTSGIGFARAYDDAANTMPRTMAQQFADYLRDLG
jgi:glucokinase